MARKLPMRPHDGEALPPKRPNRNGHESRHDGDPAGGKIARRPAESRPETKAPEGCTEQKQHGDETPHPRGAPRVDPVEEKPIAMKYVEVDDRWQEDQAYEERVSEKGLRSPHCFTAVANLVTAGIGGQRSRGDGNKQQEK